MYWRCWLFYSAGQSRCAQPPSEGVTGRIDLKTKDNATAIGAKSGEFGVQNRSVRLRKGKGLAQFCTLTVSGSR